MNVLELQVFLLAVAAPLMFLAAIIQERRRVAAALGESEERYREVVQSQRDLVCRYLPDTTLTFANDAYCRFFGRPRQELIGRRFLDLIPPGARDAAMAHVQSLCGDRRRTITYEHEVLLPDGSIGWQQWIDYAAALHPDGRISEFQGIGRDITDRKRAEDALRRNEEALRQSYKQIQELAGKLIEAQEGERARLARDLHDNVGQQLAALSIALSALRRRVGGPEARDEVARLQARTAELAEEIRHLSHELHPGVLRHAGLVAALKSRCAEFGAQHGIDTTLAADEDLGAVPPDVSLCLYRVAQEALRNVVKHARARHAKMVLTRGDGHLELTVADDGIGFDVSQARAAGGLGLKSLDERVRLINGNIAIESCPQQGTEVRVRVPLDVPLRVPVGGEP